MLSWKTRLAIAAGSILALQAVHVATSDAEPETGEGAELSARTGDNSDTLLGVALLVGIVVVIGAVEAVKEFTSLI